MLFKQQIPDSLMEQYGLTLLVETFGSNGARGYFDGYVIDVSGRKAHCVDATGAGDAFWGGMLSSLRIQNIVRASDLTGANILKALNYGNIAG